MRILAFSLFLFLFSCSTKNSVAIISLKNDMNIKSFPFNNDSLAIYIPYTFVIKNKSFNNVELKSVDYFPKMWKKVSDTYLLFDEDGEKIDFFQPTKSRIINRLSEKTLYVCLVAIIPNKRVDSIYLDKKTLGKMGFINKRLENGLSLKRQEYKDIIASQCNDTLRFSFDTNNNEIILDYSLKERKIVKSLH